MAGVVLLFIPVVFLLSKDLWPLISSTSPNIPAFLERPRDVPVFPLQGTLSWSGTLPDVTRTVKPYFGNNKIPIALIHHALRVWGPDTPFGPDAVSSKWHGIKRNHLFIDILTNHRQYQRFSRFTINRLLAPSPYGVRVVTSRDAGWGTEWGSTHIGTYIQVMAEMDMPTTTQLQLADREAMLLDVLRDLSLCFDYAQESEWVCCGLSRYLSTPCWRNRFGEDITLDEIVVRLVKREFGSGACFGTHVPMALAVIYGLNQKAEHRLIRPEIEERVRERLKQISKLLTRNQRSDGSWGIDWYHPGSSPSNPPQSYFRGDAGKMAATGHHLEWMTHCPPELRPREEVMAAATLFLVRTLPGLVDEIEYDFHLYPPATHAVRALLNVCGIRWAKPEWLADQVPPP